MLYCVDNSLTWDSDLSNLAFVVKIWASRSFAVKGCLCA